MDIEFGSSPKKDVNKIIAWLCSLGYFVIFFEVLAIIISGTLKRLLKFSRLNSFDLVLIVSLVLVTGFLIFCLNFFEWVLNPRLEVKNNSVIFKTDDVVAALGRATTSYTIKSVRDISIKKSSVIVKGDIIVKEPLVKSKSKSSCEITRLYDDEVKNNVVNILKEFKK